MKRKSNEILVYGLFIGMLLFVFMAFGVQSGCVQDDVVPGLILEADEWFIEYGGSSLNDTRDDSITTDCFAKATDNYIVFPHWGGATSEYTLIGITVYGEEWTRGGTYNLSLDLSIDGDDYNDVWFEKDTWSEFYFDEPYDYDESLNVTANFEQFGGVPRIYELHFIYAFQSTPSFVEIYPYQNSDCVPTNPEVSLWISGATYGCEMYLNVSYYISDDGVNYTLYDTFNESSSSVATVQESFHVKQFKYYNRTYYHRFNATLGGGDYDSKSYENRTYYFNTEVCPPPDGIPPNPKISDLIPDFSLDCWEMVSVPSWYNVSVFWSNFSLYNESAGTFHSWNHSIANGTHFNGLFWWNSTSQSYDNMSNGKYMEPYKGYFIYFFDKNYSLHHNYTLGGGDQDETLSDGSNFNFTDFDGDGSWLAFTYTSYFNDTNPDSVETGNWLVSDYFVYDAVETMANDSYRNFTDFDGYGSWLNVTWGSWFNDSTVDTLETALGLDAFNINSSAYDPDESMNQSFYYNVSDDNLTYFNHSWNAWFNDSDSDTIEIGNHSYVYSVPPYDTDESRSLSDYFNYTNFDGLGSWINISRGSWFNDSNPDTLEHETGIFGYDVNDSAYDVDNDESMYDSSYMNFTDYNGYGSWFNVSYESWFNDTNPDELETILEISEYDTEIKYPQIEGLTNASRWRMISAFSGEDGGTTTFWCRLINETEDHSWDWGVANGWVYNGIFDYNETTNTWDNVTYLENNRGYWIYINNEDTYFANRYWVSEDASLSDDPSGHVSNVYSDISANLLWDGDSYSEYMSMVVTDYVYSWNGGETFNYTDLDDYDCVDYLNFTMRFHVTGTISDDMIEWCLGAKDPTCSELIDTDLVCPTNQSMNQSFYYNVSDDNLTYFNHSWNVWFNDSDSDTIEIGNNSYIYEVPAFDNDESMYDSGSRNFTDFDGNGSWVSINWGSWFNDSTVDTLETALGLDAFNINSSAYDPDESRSLSDYFNYTNFDGLGSWINISRGSWFNDSNPDTLEHETGIFGYDVNDSAYDVDNNESMYDSGSRNFTDFDGNGSWVSINWGSWFNDSTVDTLETALGLDAFFVNYTVDNDESMYDSGSRNFTDFDGYGSWLNVTWGSWFNDSTVDTIETALGLDAFNINDSAYDVDNDESMFTNGFRNFSNYDGYGSWFNVSYESWFNDSTTDTLETTQEREDYWYNATGNRTGSKIYQGSRFDGAILTLIPSFTLFIGMVVTTRKKRLKYSDTNK